MRPKNFTTVSYAFRLFDTRDQPVTSMPFELQYLDANNQEWTIFHKARIVNGAFFFEELINPVTGLPASIFLQDNRIPELRLVAVPPVYSGTKPEVLAFTCQLTSNPNAGTLEFNFGACSLIEKEVLPVGDMFADFIVITSPISLVNQMNNIRLIQSLQADNRAKAEEIAALKVDIRAKDMTIASLDNQLVSALSRLEEKTLALVRLESIKRELEATILSLQEQVTLLQQQLDIDSRPVPVNTLYTQLVQEIDTSTQNNTASGYKLANISLKLKTLITRDENGISAQLFDLSTMDQLNGGAISELTFDIAPSTTPAPQTTTVPNLLGLTETAVRKILVSLGLRLNPVFQNNPQIVDGDSFKQTPVEGTAFNTNDFVTVIFSKHE